MSDEDATVGVTDSTGDRADDHDPALQPARVLPAQVHRRFKPVGYFMMACGAVMVFGPIVLPMDSPIIAYREPVFFGFTAIVAVWFGVYVIRWRRRARAAGGLLCAHCGYDLRGVPEGACPECGKVFTHASLRAEWRTREYADADETPDETSGDGA